MEVCIVDFNDLVLKIVFIGLGTGLVVGFTIGFVAKSLDFGSQLLNYFGLGRR